MKRFTLAFLATLTWCTCASAIQSWTGMGPGAGGNFTSADISGSNIVVASDNGGLFKSTDGGSTWTRRGWLDGLPTNFIVFVRFDPNDGTKILAGTEDGLFRSTDTGTGWAEVGNSVFGGKKVTAIGWSLNANDAGVVFAAFRDGNSAYVYKSEDHGATWGSTAYITISNADSNDATYGVRRDRLPVKIVVDPTTYGSDGTGHERVVYLLMGQGVAGMTSGGNSVGREEIWRSRYSSGSRSVDRIAWINGVKANIIDMAHSGSAGAFAVTVHGGPSSLDNSNASAIATPRYGRIFTATTSGGTISWTDETPSLQSTWKWDGGAGCHDVTETSSSTGAVWYSGSDLYVQTISADACGGGNGACATATDSSVAGRAGRYKKSSGSWSRVDDGRGSTGSAWEVGWATCGLARGATLASNGMAATSQTLSPDGTMWVSGQYVWKYNGSKYARVFTDHDNSSPYNTTLIDNANAAVIALDGSTPWVGYYDLGLWKYMGGGWENKNVASTNWGNSAGTGGNVNGIAINGSTIVVTEATSSKQNNWTIWYSTSGGATNSWSQAADANMAGQHTYLRGLCFDGTYYWVTAGDASDKRAVYRASTPSGTWTKKRSSAGMLSVGSNGSGTVLVGGLYELYRTTNGGTSWSTIDLVPSASDQVVPTTILSADTTDDLHAMRWGGVQDITYESMSGRWLVTVWAPTTYSSGPKGVYVSTDDGQTFSKLGGANSPADSVLRRAVAVDSCGLRYHITSGQMFSSPVDGTGNTVHQIAGVQTCRFTGGGTLVCVPEICDGFSGGHRDSKWGFTSAHGIATFDDGLFEDNSATVYVLAPGYGTQMYQTTGGNCVERPGMSRQRPHQEVEAPPNVGRRSFNVQEAAALIQSGKLELFDVSGRRVRDPRPGIYFSVLRNTVGAVTTRHTVVVTP